MGGAMFHFEGEHLSLSNLVGQVRALLSYHRFCHSIAVLSQSIDLFICFVFDYSQIFALFYDASLLRPPLLSLDYSVHLVLPDLHVADLRNNLQ